MFLTSNSHKQIKIKNERLLYRGLKSNNVCIFSRQIFFGLNEFLSSSESHLPKLYTATNPQFTISSSTITYNTSTLFCSLKAFTGLSRYKTSFNIVIIITAISLTSRKAFTSEARTKRIIIGTSTAERKRFMILYTAISKYLFWEYAHLSLLTPWYYIDLLQ